MATPLVFHLHQPGTERRPAGQRVEAVDRRGARGRHLPGAAFQQLLVQRQARHVRAAHHHVDEAGGRLAAAVSAGGSGNDVAPRVVDRGAMHAGGQRQQIRIAPGRRDQRDAEGQACAGESGGHGDGREIHEVHEIRVRAEAAVERDGIGFDLGDAEVRAGGGQQQHIGACPDALAPRGSVPSGGIGARKASSRPRRRAGLDDAARDLEHGLRAVTRAGSSVARYRSATHGSSYSRRAASSSGVMSTSTASPPRPRSRSMLVVEQLRVRRVAEEFALRRARNRETE